MAAQELQALVEAALKENFEFEAGEELGNDGQLDDDYLDRLRFFFSDDLILAALDLVERDNVIKLNTQWGHAQYQVLGTTATYSVFPSDTMTLKGTTAYCTCPSFAFSVLLADSQYMCKHLLAVALAHKLKRCIERPVNPNDLARVHVHQAK